MSLIPEKRRQPDETSSVTLAALKLTHSRRSERGHSERHTASAPCRTGGATAPHRQYTTCLVSFIHLFIILCYVFPPGGMTCPTQSEQLSPHPSSTISSIFINSSTLYSNSILSICFHFLIKKTLDPLHLHSLFVF